MTIHATNNIHTPSTPRHLKITQTMVEDFIIDPVLGIRVIFNTSLDVFQQSALRTYWWVPDVIDSSGFGSGKSLRAWLYSNLRCIILGDQWGWAYYQSFQAGKDIFWPYYEKYNSRSAPLFAAQLGKLDEDGDTSGKDNTKGPAAYTQHFKNGSKMVLPAPGWFQSAKTQAGLTFNFAIVDEWTKIETMSKKKPGRGRMQEYEAGGIDQQIQGRLRRECFNQFHPLWGNHCKFMATAESLQHPAARRLKAFQREIAKGNPHFAIISYNFKHFSNRRNHEGRAFRDIPNWQRIKAMKATFTPAHFLREGLGVWARETSGIYPEDSLERCVAAGTAAGIQPQIGRDQDYRVVQAGQVFERITHDSFLQMPQTGGTHFFLGVDPAPSQTRKADDGAMAILRARPKPGLGRPVTANAADWETAFVWAYRVRGAVHDPGDEGIAVAENNRQWSGLIHARHRVFGFSGICMDPQGGGSMVMTELNQTRQLINNVELQVTPIVTPDNIAAGVAANYILTMFRLRDNAVKALWPILQGEDSLYDAMHMTFQQAVEHAMVLWPKPFNNRDPEEYKDWPPELRWALKNLDAAREQLSNIQAATQDNGEWLLTGNNAKSYSAMGKKDLAYACIYAYIRFLIWLKQNELEFTGTEEESGGGFYSFQL